MEMLNSPIHCTSIYNKCSFLKTADNERWRNSLQSSLERRIKQTKIMSCLNAETHININSLVPYWSHDEGHSPSDKLSADSWIPYCTHYPWTLVPYRNGDQCSRWHGNEELCLMWSQGGNRNPHSQLFVRFSLLNKSINQSIEMYQWVFKSQTISPKAQLCFVLILKMGLIYPRMASVLLYSWG